MEPFNCLHLVTGAGFSRAVAASALGVNGVGNLASKVVWGYGLRCFDARRLAAFAYSISSTGVALLIIAGATGPQAALFPALFFYGFGFGGTVPVSEFLWARYFGRQHLGAMRGIEKPIAVLGAGLGPVALGAWFDATGDYTLGITAAICAYVLGALAVNVSQPHQRLEADGARVESFQMIAPLIHCTCVAKEQSMEARHGRDANQRKVNLREGDTSLAG